VIIGVSKAVLRFVTIRHYVPVRPSASLLPSIVDQIESRRYRPGPLHRDPGKKLLA